MFRSNNVVSLEKWCHLYKVTFDTSPEPPSPIGVLLMKASIVPLRNFLCLRSSQKRGAVTEHFISKNPAAIELASSMSYTCAILVEPAAALVLFCLDCVWILYYFNFQVGFCESCIQAGRAYYVLSLSPWTTTRLVSIAQLFTFRPWHLGLKLSTICSTCGTKSGTSAHMWISVSSRSSISSAGDAEPWEHRQGRFYALTHLIFVNWLSDGRTDQENIHRVCLKRFPLLHLILYLTNIIRGLEWQQ